VRRRRAAQQSCRLRRGARGRRERRSGATGHVATCAPTLNRSVALERIASHYIALRCLAFHGIGFQCLALRPLTSYCRTKHCSRCVFYQHAQYALCGLVRTCINACTDKCNRANESDNLFFVHLSGARNVGYNDQHEGGNGIHTSREHSPKLPRCHSGRTSRFEREASRELGQHATWPTDTAGTAARGSPNRAFFSCHQWAANAPGCSQRR